MTFFQERIVVQSIMLIIGFGISYGTILMNFMMKICKNVKVSKLNTVRKTVFLITVEFQYSIPEEMDGTEHMSEFSQILESTGNVPWMTGSMQMKLKF